MNTVDVRPSGSDLTVYIRGNKRFDHMFVPGFPKIKDSFHKIDNTITAFNMALLAQKMDQKVFTMGYFVNPC